MLETGRLAVVKIPIKRHMYCFVQFSARRMVTYKNAAEHVLLSGEIKRKGSETLAELWDLGIAMAKREKECRSLSRTTHKQQIFHLNS